MVGDTAFVHVLSIINAVFFSYDLVVLRELISSVSGLEAEVFVTAENLEVQCGGDRLQKEVRNHWHDRSTSIDGRIQAGYSSNNRTSQRAVSRLCNSLADADLLTCLAIMVGSLEDIGLLIAWLTCV